MGLRGTKVDIQKKKKFYDLFFNQGMGMTKIAEMERKLEIERAKREGREPVALTSRQLVRYHIVTYQKLLQEGKHV